MLNQSIDLFAQYIADKTDGRYRIENYGSSQLGNERDLIEGVSLGTVDMTLVTTSPMANFIPEAQFYDLPALYKDLDHVHAVAESPVVTEMLAGKLLEKNLRMLAVTDGGFRNITNNVRPIVTMKDFAGIKMRVQESPMIIATYEAIPGVTPVPVPIGDLYTSLDQGIVDAQENPALLIRDFKLNEVQDYMTLTGHSYFPRLLMINENVWKSIEPADQAIFEAAADEMKKFKNAFYADADQKVLAELAESGMEIVEPGAGLMDDLFEIMKEQVYPKFYAEIGSGDEAAGRDIVDAIVKLGRK